MSIKDKLEIGLKPDAPYRRDNLSEHEQDDPCVEPGQPGETAEEKRAREACQKTEGDVVDEDESALLHPRRRVEPAVKGH